MVHLFLNNRVKFLFDQEKETLSFKKIKSLKIISFTIGTRLEVSWEIKFHQVKTFLFQLYLVFNCVETFLKENSTQCPFAIRIFQKLKKILR